MVHLDILQTDFLFVECPSEHILETVKKIILKDRFDEFKEKLESDPIHAFIKGKTILMNGGGSVIWLPKNDNKTLLHEVVHAIKYLLAYRDMPLTDENEELYASLISWLYFEIKAPN